MLLAWINACGFLQRYEHRAQEGRLCKKKSEDKRSALVRNHPTVMMKARADTAHATPITQCKKLKHYIAVGKSRIFCFA
jgi:hypothetical protein